MKCGLHFDVPSDVYHSDPCPEISLSASIAHTLVSRSPYHAWLQHPRLGGRPRKATKAMDTGSVCHAILLGVGKGYEVVTGFDDWRKSAAQAYRKEIEERGNVAMLEKDFTAANELAESVRPKLKALGIEFTGNSEVMAVWDETTDQGESVRCRGQLDHLIVNSGTIYDLKLVRSAHPRACQSHIFGFGGDIQAAAYERALVQRRPALAGRVTFLFVFVEVDTGIVTPATLAASMRALGESRWLRGVKTWADCRAKNLWPGYVPGVTALEAPAWAWSSEEDAQISENWTGYAAPDGPSKAFPPAPGEPTDGSFERDDHLF